MRKNRLGLSSQKQQKKKVCFLTHPLINKHQSQKKLFRNTFLQLAYDHPGKSDVVGRHVR